MQSKQSNIKNPYDKICKYRFCQKPFIAERLNLDYCTHQCKYTENNFKRKEERDVIKSGFRKALKSFRVLHQFYTAKIYEVTWEQLLKAGFEYRNSTDRAKDGSDNYTIPVYYKYKLIALGNNKFRIEEI